MPFVESNSTCANAFLELYSNTISRLSVNSLLQTSEWSDIKGDLSLDGEITNFDYRAELSYSGRIQHNIRGSLNLNRELRTFATKASYNGKEVATLITRKIQNC
jgi:hypothetical protein